MFVFRRDPLLFAMAVMAVSPGAGCTRESKRSKGSQETPDRTEAMPGRSMTSPPKPRAGVPMTSRMAPPQRPAAIKEVRPPAPKKMPRSAFRATVGRPKTSAVVKLTARPEHVHTTVLSVAPRGGTRWVAVVSARRKATGLLVLLVALLDKVNGQWTLVWKMTLDASRTQLLRGNQFQPKPEPNAFATAALQVRDWDHDGKPEALIRYGFMDVKHGLNCAFDKLAILNLDGAQPRVAVQALVVVDCPSEGSRKGHIYHRDLNKDGHPDLQVVKVVRSVQQRGDGVSPGVTHHDEVDRTEVQYLWDSKTDTYKRGKTVNKSYSKPHDF